MQRDISLDLARGFTVLLIPAIHTVMVCSKPEVYGTWLGMPLAFIAEGPGAQLFMLLMGMGLVFKRPTANTVFKKSALLILAGFVLNYLKFGLLLNAGLLPDGVKHELQIDNSQQGLLQVIIIGDILHFAAIALVITWFIRQLKYYWWWSVAFAILVVFVSPYCWDLQGNYLLQLAGGKPPQVFFPIFPWLAYPLIGLTVGHYWKINAALTANISGWTGLMMVLLGVAVSTMFDEASAAGFYRTRPGETIWHIGIVLLALHLWKHVENLVKGERLFLQLLCFCSRNITSLYFIQWVLICWALPFTGYQTLGLFESVVVAIYMTAFTLGITRFIFKSNYRVQQRTV